MKVKSDAEDNFPGFKTLLGDMTKFTIGKSVSDIVTKVQLRSFSGTFWNYKDIERISELNIYGLWINLMLILFANVSKFDLLAKHRLLRF